MGFVQRLFDPVGQAADGVAKRYFLERAAGADHYGAIRRVLVREFPNNAQLCKDIEVSFDNATWEETELGEAQQLAIAILNERFGMPDGLQAALKLSHRVEAAFEAGPSHVYAERVVRRPHHNGD